MAENKIKTALEVELKYMAIQAKEESAHTEGPGVHFIPKPPDEQVPIENNNQRLDAIYDDGPLGFERDPVAPSAKMLAQDPLEEVNLGEGTEKRPTYISAKLDPEVNNKAIHMLKEYKDYFAWDYDEMPGLSRDLVELKLPKKDS